MKYIFLLIILLAVLLSACATPTGDVTSTSEAQVQSYTQDIVTGGCPSHITDDAYPGLCGIYKDENHNGECDYGE